MIAFAIALIASLIASFIDVRERKIPNLITFPLLAIGLLFSLFRDFLLFIPLLISFSLLFLMWKISLIGGGDVKLLMGIFALLNEDFYSIISFLIILSIVLFFHFLFFGLIESLRRKELKIFIMSISAIFSAGIMSYLIIHIPIVSLLSSLIVGDIISSFLPYSKKVSIENAGGEILAENIEMKNGKLIRQKVNPSVFRRAFEKRNKQYLAKAFEVLDNKKLQELKKYCNEVEVFITYPMAPLIFFSVLLFPLFKNIYVYFISV